MIGKNIFALSVVVGSVAMGISNAALYCQERVLLQPAIRLMVKPRIILIKKSVNGMILIKREDFANKEWLYLENDLSGLKSLQNKYSIPCSNLIDLYLAKSIRYFLCAKSLKSQVLIREEKKRDKLIATIQQNIVPSRMFVTKENEIVLAQSDLHNNANKKYHFAKVNLKGELENLFGPSVALPDSIPPYSIYYMGAYNYSPRYGYIISYFFLPQVLVYMILILT